MTYAASRLEYYLIASLVSILLYSTTFSVIAQDRARGPNLPIHKVKLSLLQFPGEVEPPITNLQLNNFEKASLKISPNINQSLLFPYLPVEKDPLKIKSLINDKEDKPKEVPTLAYISPVLTSVTPIDRKAWDAQIRSKYRNGLVETVAPGIKHIVINRYTKAGPMHINVVEVNPALNPNIKIEPALASTTLPHIKKVYNIVRENDAIVGINASFFKPSSGVPLGTLIINDELITGPIYNRVVLGIKDNKFKMARINLEGQIKGSDGTEIKINNVNQPRMLSSYSIIYSKRWGKIAPPTPKYGIQVAIDNEKVIDISENRLNIPETGYVLVGPKSNLGSLKVDDPVKISFHSDPDWSDVQHAVGGGPYLVRDGQIYVDVADQNLGSITGRNPRTAVGYTSDNKFIMVTVDGRQKSSIGASLYELARLMKEFGCYNAMNFDGGGSTQMIVGKRIVNYPNNKGGSYVSNGLIVKIQN